MVRYLSSLLSFGVVLLLGTPLCSGIMSTSSIRRQANVVSNGAPPRPPPPSPPQSSPVFLSEELLPPPALSASFPTLRPRRPAPPVPPPRQQNHQRFPGVNNNFQQPPRDLVPPFRPSPQIPNANGPGRRPPNPPQNPAPPPPPPSSNAQQPQKFDLLPPIEIPPERPLTDNEILATLVPKETSFIPTTGQGVPSPSVGIVIPPGSGGAQAPVSLEQSNSIVPAAGNSSSSSSSVVRFPTESELISQGPVASPQIPQASPPPPRNCPTCECTNEVDYICASNGVLYLNSCSFDCATFCDSGLRKVELNVCASQNQK